MLCPIQSQHTWRGFYILAKTLTQKLRIFSIKRVVAWEKRLVCLSVPIPWQIVTIEVRVVTSTSCLTSPHPDSGLCHCLCSQSSLGSAWGQAAHAISHHLPLVTSHKVRSSKSKVKDKSQSLSVLKHKISAFISIIIKLNDLTIQIKYITLFG